MIILQQDEQRKQITHKKRNKKNKQKGVLVSDCGVIINQNGYTNIWNDSIGNEMRMVV